MRESSLLSSWREYAKWRGIHETLFIAQRRGSFSWPTERRGGVGEGGGEVVLWYHSARCSHHSATTDGAQEELTAELAGSDWCCFRLCFLYRQSSVPPTPHPGGNVICQGWHGVTTEKSVVILLDKREEGRRQNISIRVDGCWVTATPCRKGTN